MVRPEDSLVALPSALSRSPRARPMVVQLCPSATSRSISASNACWVLTRTAASTRSRSHGAVTSRSADAAGGVGDGSCFTSQPAAAPRRRTRPLLGRHHHLVGLRLRCPGNCRSCRLCAGALAQPTDGRTGCACRRAALVRLLRPMVLHPSRPAGSLVMCAGKGANLTVGPGGLASRYPRLRASGGRSRGAYRAIQRVCVAD